MTLARATIIRGPAIATRGTAVYFFEGDLTVTPVINTVPRIVDMFGQIDENLDTVMFTVEGTPTEWEALTDLFPHQTPSIGTSIFGTTDTDLVINTKAGQKLTFKASAVTQMPSIHLSANPNNRLLGPMQFTCIGKNNETWATADHFAAVATEAYASTAFDSTKLYCQPYTAKWGSVAPWSAFQTADGIIIEPSMEYELHTTDTAGIVDATLSNVTVMARFQPVGVSEKQLIDLLKIQNTGIARGVSLSANTEDLIISGTGVHVTVYNAAPKAGPMQFGSATLRIGEVGMVATSSFTLGVADALFRIGTAAP